MPGRFEQQELFSVSEVARILSVSERTVWSLVKKKELAQPYTLPGTKSCRRWFRFDIEQYLDKTRRDAR